MTAAQLQADGVELDFRTEVPLSDLSQTGIRQLRKWLDDANVRLAAVTYPTRRGYDVAAELDRRLQGTCQAMQIAAKLGARVLVGRICDDLPADDDPRCEVLQQSLELLAREGNRLGARFAIETSDFEPSELAALLGKFSEGTLATAVHPGKITAAGHDVHQALEQLSDSIAYVTAGDSIREFGTGKSVAVELGRGSVDWPAVMAQLDAQGYQGWATIDGSGTNDPETFFGNAVSYLRSLSGF
ncbi:sugar phosphate isomerase/epimerase family protein [Aeoliella mucimassa]|uniref:Xylose isomerase-like TIM barrel n=1 Tax=Aeoliella mucimassa TaxID=2527972 RepID=A0A518AWM0_9BACT|nr:sugar phosphate isomerase/epimerase family protein [Aeoliella mucimassa]QDU59091.1 Xylose isomerase-like TIM barrel [Aeoliella mucimassa]